MSKAKVRGALYMMILFAAVAVFLMVVLVPSANVERQGVSASQFTGPGILLADGTDPVPGPSPLPWGLTVA